MSLEVRVEYADGLKDTELLGKQDPYCILQLGHVTSRTRTCTDGGTRPVWNEALRFNAVDPNTCNDLIVTIKNENMVQVDDIIGRVVVPLRNVRQVGHESGTYPVVTAAGKQKGTLRLTLTYSGAGGTQSMGYRQAQAPPYGQPYPPQYQQQQQQQPYQSHSPPPQQYQQPAYGAPAAAYPPQAAPYNPDQQQQQQYQGTVPAGYPTPGTYPPAVPQQQWQQQQQYGGVPGAAGVGGVPPGYPPPAPAGYPTPGTYPPAAGQHTGPDPRFMGQGHGSGMNAMNMNPLAAGGLGGAAGLVAGAVLGSALGGHHGGHHGGGGLMGMVAGSGMGVHGMPYGAGMMQGGYKHKKHKGHKGYKYKGHKHKKFKMKRFKRKGWK